MKAVTLIRADMTRNMHRFRADPDGSAYGVQVLTDPVNALSRVEPPAMQFVPVPAPTSMAVGFGSNDLPDPVTLIGKIVLNVVAVGGWSYWPGKSGTGPARLRNDNRALLNN